jgi:tetratricopeptide (TPR) repeat protein
MNTRFLFLFVLMLAFAPVCFAEEITECDRAAAHPSDPDHVGTGLDSNDVVTHVAIPACKKAMAADPANPRFHYQLGRALVYWAFANDGDITEGLEHLKHASDMKYSQAMFVYGLMQYRQGDICAAEPLYRSAAGQNLRSARISYVNEVLSGAFEPCPVTASADEMMGFLEAAQEQVSGYYENMLLSTLKRQLLTAYPELN